MFRSHIKVFGAVVWSAAVLVGCAHKATVTVAHTPTPAPSPTVRHVASPLNGVPVLPPAVKHRIAAVMIDNYPYEARPQSGLAQADIVYEAEAEGGITRYMALYLENAPAKIGPVRSARLYFVDLARPYRPLFAHAGENDDVWEPLKELRADGFADMEEILQAGEAFWRDGTRNMPHNLYTSIARLRGSAPNHGWPDAPFNGSEFAFVKPAPAPPAVAAPAASPSGAAAAVQAAHPAAIVPILVTPIVSSAAADPVPDTPAPSSGAVPSVTLDFWRHYEVRYTFDRGAYLRSIGGVVQHDLENARPYRVADIIALWIPATVMDDVGDLHMNVYGRFPAIAVRNGKATECTWVAPGPDTLPRIVDAAEKNVALVPGQIYIEVLPQGGRVTVGNQTWTH